MVPFLKCHNLVVVQSSKELPNSGRHGIKLIFEILGSVRNETSLQRHFFKTSKGDYYTIPKSRLDQIH